MKNSYLLLLLSIFALHPSFAQVKKQYQQDNSQTMVVVKETLSSDEDILNNLDPDDYGMHQVIKITTENEKKAVPKAITATNSLEAITDQKQPKVKLTETPPVNLTNKNENLLADRPVKMKRWSVRDKTLSTPDAKKNRKPLNETVSSNISKSTTPISLEKSVALTSNRIKRGNGASRNSDNYGKSSKRKNPRFKKAKRKKFKRNGLLKCFKF